VDPSAVAAGQLPDVCDDGFLLLLAVRQVEIPVWGTVVPQKIVAAQDELVDGCEVGDGVRWTVVVIAGSAAIHDLPFHLILGNDETGLLAHQIDERRIAGYLGCRDRGPVQEPLLGRQLAKRQRLRRPDGEATAPVPSAVSPAARIRRRVGTDLDQGDSCRITYPRVLLVSEI